MEPVGAGEALLSLEREVASLAAIDWGARVAASPAKPTMPADSLEQKATIGLLSEEVRVMEQTMRDGHEQSERLRLAAQQDASQSHERLVVLMRKLHATRAGSAAAVAALQKQLYDERALRKSATAMASLPAYDGGSASPGAATAKRISELSPVVADPDPVASSVQPAALSRPRAELEHEPAPLPLSSQSKHQNTSCQLRQPQEHPSRRPSANIDAWPRR